MHHLLIQLAETLDEQNKFKKSDSVLGYLSELTDKYNKDQDMESYLKDMKERFMDFLSEVVIEDYKNDGESDLDPEKIVHYYFKNREKYEKTLLDYDLMLGQTEGLIANEDFSESFENNKPSSGPIIKHGKDV